MSIFNKVFSTKTTVSVLDDTFNHQDNEEVTKIRRSSALSQYSSHNKYESKSHKEPQEECDDETGVSLVNCIPSDEEQSEVDVISLINNGDKMSAVQVNTNYNNNNPSYSYNNLQDYNEMLGTREIINIQQQDQQQVVNNPQGENAEKLDEDKVQIMMNLYAAIIRGEKSEVKKITTSNREVLEERDNFGRTPLMYCVLSDRLDCAKSLIKMGCQLNSIDKAGRSALHLAAHKGSYKILELLTERGGDIHIKDKDGQTPLHLTTRNRHARCLEYLLKRLSPGLVDVTDNQNRSALHWSAAFNNVECVKLLIKNNINVAMGDREGKTPLHWAANNHHPRAVATIKILLETSPSVINWQDYEGRTAIHFAVAVENTATVEYLLNFQPIICEVDRLDNTFRTPLHWAAQLGNVAIVEHLLHKGAKSSISDSNGATPLLYAALNNNPEVVLKMIKADIKVLDHADIEGRTALMWAAGKGANDVIMALLQLKVNQDNGHNQSNDEHSQSKNNKGNRLKKSKVVDVNRTDNKGNTGVNDIMYVFLILIFICICYRLC